MKENRPIANEASRRAWIKAAIEQYETPLLRYASRLTGHHESARDVVQEVFLRLWREESSNQNGNPSVDDHLAQWLYTVCRNRAIDVRRKEGRMTTTTIDESSRAVEQSPAQLAENAESQSSVMDALTALPPNQEEAIRLKFQGGLSYKEIAAVMDTTTNNVGVLIHTGMKKLRTQAKSEPQTISLKDRGVMPMPNDAINNNNPTASRKAL